MGQNWYFWGITKHSGSYVLGTFYPVVLGDLSVGTPTFSNTLTQLASGAPESNSYYMMRWEQRSTTESATSIVNPNHNGGTSTFDQTLATSGKLMPKTYSVVPTRTGYNFNGYYMNLSNGQQFFYDKFMNPSAWMTTTNPYDTRTINAQWLAVQFDITLDMTGGNGGTGSVGVTYDQPMPSATAPSRTGYTFLGYWDTSSTSGGTQYYNANMTSARNWDKTTKVTLYARWQEIRTTVTLDPDGGSGGTTSVQVDYDQPMPSATAPSRTGYSFNGYFTEKNGQGIQYYDGSMKSTVTYRQTSNITLYAYWVPTIYKLTLNHNGGSSSTNSVNATYNQVMPNGIEKPILDHYVFKGYYDAVSGGKKYYNADMSSANVWDKTENYTLYAQWAKNDFLITFDANGGVGGTTQVHATYNADMPAATAPTKVGYKFDGYFDALVGGRQYYNADMSSARVWDKTENFTLYAHWTVMTYTVTLNSNGGSQGTSSITVPYGENMPNATAPYKKSHNFLGYFDAASDGKQYYNADMSSASVWDKAQNSTLYAQWDAKSYTVTFDRAEGTGGTESITVKFGEVMPTADAPTRERIHLWDTMKHMTKMATILQTVDRFMI